MRFVVDGMLGGLARWLRMLGYETQYEPNVDDDTLLQESQANEAVLLTRDEELHNRAKKRNIASVLVLGDAEDVRLAQLAKNLGISLEINMTSTRCPVCGSTIAEISKNEAAKSVPATSLKLYDRFWRCTNESCAKTYWVGSHWKRIHETLEGARRIPFKE